MHWHNILGIPYRVGIREHIELELKKNFCTNLVPLLYQTLIDLWRQNPALREAVREGFPERALYSSTLSIGERPPLAISLPERCPVCVGVGFPKPASEKNAKT